MRESNPLSDEEIRAEVDTFMVQFMFLTILHFQFEGHDTTAAATTWATYLLASHPDIQKRAQKEIDEVLGQEKTWPSYDDLEKMNYLGMVLKETLRLYPSVPLLTRRTDKTMFICGKEVPPHVNSLFFTSLTFPD